MKTLKLLQILISPLFLTIACTALSACGLKGNLYLPEKSPVVTSAPTQSESSSASSVSSPP